MHYWRQPEVCIRWLNSFPVLLSFFLGTQSMFRFSHFRGYFYNSNMASLSERMVSHGPETKLLTAEQAERSVLVTNLGSQTADKDIVIYFQRTNGGGEIDHVHIPHKGTAVVTFGRSEVVETVLQHSSHTLRGSELKVERFVPKESPEVYSHVEARVNFGKFDPLSQDTQSILEVLKTNTGVESHRISSGCLSISGTFIQVEAAHKILHCLMKGKGNAAEAQPDASNELNILGSNSSNTSDSNSLEVQPQLMQLLKRVYKKKLQDIEDTFSVEIDWVENTTQVWIRRSKVPNGPVRLQEGCEAFINLYQAFHPNMGREEVELPDRIDESLVNDVVSRAEANSPVIIEKAHKNLVIYAEKSGIRRCVQFLKENLGLTSERSSKRNRRGQGNKTQDASVHDKTSTQGRYFPAQYLHQVLSNEVKLSLYQGDITDEAVDAIVNAANERLQHGAGVAAAIVHKGGWQIQQESNLLINYYGQLDVGRAVYTSGGSLSCRYVIHTVGPVWYKHGKENSISLLHRACLESLFLAVTLHLSSIALTAISSGIFGMPKDTCAEVMFFAIEEFSSSEDAKSSTLRDVRIVIIDEPTLSVFQEEFVKRYRGQKASLESASTQGRSPDDQETTSSARRPENDEYQSGRNDSSLLTGQTETDDKKSSGKQSMEKSDQRAEVGKNTKSTVPNGIKEVSFSNHDNKNADKKKLSTGELKGNEESDNPRDNGPARKVATAEGNENAACTALPGTVRERGTIEPNFHNSRGKELSEGNVAVIERQGSTPADTTTATSPPGLTVTQEGQTLAELVNNPVNGSQEGNADHSSKERDAVDKAETRGENTTKLNQVQDSECTNQRADSENSHTILDTKDQRTKNESHQKTEAFTNEQSRKRSSVEDMEKVTPGSGQHKERDPPFINKQEAVSSQEPVTRRTKKEEMQSTMESSTQDGFSASYPDTLSNHSVSPNGVTKVVKDNIRERRRDTEDWRSQNHVSGTLPQSGYQGSEQGCFMCMNLNDDPIFLWRCGRNHYCCKSCKDFLLNRAGTCPQCRKEGLPRGNQPIGDMTWITVRDRSLPGYDNCGIITTRFSFSEGVQGREHPNPGSTYNALRITAFLPFNSEGIEICNLLRQAFEEGLLFTIGKSPTTGEENKIISNDIELKTSQSGGAASYGYPDPSYIDRVKKQLADKGITQSHK